MRTVPASVRPIVATGRTAGRTLSIEFAGAILAGGRSRRMGTDKAALDPYGRGPMLASVRDALLGADAAEVVVIGGDPELAGRLGLRHQPDLHPDEGPLGGILTAFEVSRHDLVAIIACDMPFLDATVITALVLRAELEPQGDAFLPEVDGRLQPLSGLWRRSRCQSLLRREYTRGQRAPRRLLGLLDVRSVPVDDPSRLLDIDSPDDIGRYAHHLPPSEPRTSRG